MNYRSAFITITGIVMVVLFLTYNVYINKINVETTIALQSQPTTSHMRSAMQNVSDITRKLTSQISIENRNKPLGKCTLPFNCSNGNNPPFEYSFKNISFSDLNSMFPDVKPGGNWSPEECDPGQKVAIVIPFRKREEHLKLLLVNLIPFLKTQKRSFTVFVIEQAGSTLFNRASMMSVGYIEAVKADNYSCFVFHDVDMVPKRLCNLYECKPNEATHLGVSRNSDPPRAGYRDYMGGVLALHKNVVQKINGFSNIMFGWGGEDDEIFMRLKKEKVTIIHRKPAVGDYVMPKHKRDGSNPLSSRSIKECYENADLRSVDGLTSLTYDLKHVTKEPLFTKVTVEIPGPKTQSETVSYYKQARQVLEKKLKTR